MVTALAAFTMLPFTGCSSSQQQQAGDEVEASGEQGGDSQAEASSQQSGGGDETAAAGSEESGNPASGSEVVTNDAVAANAPAGEGDLQEIVQEMGNGNGSQQAAAPAANGAAPAAVAATEEGSDQQAAPAANAAAPANAAPAATASAAAAPAPAAVGGLPETGSKMPYVVEAGDTLGKISTKVYGDQKRWRDISSLTGLSDPNHIFPGDVVYYALDEKSAQFAANYESIKRGKEVVQSGDTLATIAKRVYGSSRSWRHIWRQNDHIENPDKLETGTTVYYVQKDSIKTANNTQKTNKTNVKTIKTVNAKTLKTIKSVTAVKTKTFTTVSYLV